MRPGLGSGDQGGQPEVGPELLLGHVVLKLGSGRVDQLGRLV